MMENRYLQALSGIAWGYLLLYLDLNLGTVNLLPDWLGLIFIYRALAALGEREPSALLLNPFALLLTGYEGLLWLAAMFSYTPQRTPLVLFFGIISLYFHFQLLTNLASIAARSNLDDASRSLLRLRSVQTILLTLHFMPLPWERYGILLASFLLLNVVVALWLCITIFSYRKEELRKAESQMQF